MNLKKYDLKLLIVDDDDKILTFLKELFQHNIKTIFYANDAKTGLKIFKEKFPDIILTDLIMPDMTGLEMVAEIKKIRKNNNIVLMSGCDETDFLKDAFKQGINYYLQKPFNISETKNIVLNIAKTILFYKEQQINKLILETVEEGILTIDENFKIQTINSYAEKISNYKKKELINKSIDFLFNDLKNILINNNKKQIKFFYKLNSKNNQNVKVNLKIFCLDDENKNYSNKILIFKALLPSVYDSKPFKVILGKNKKIKEMIDVVSQVADSEATILLTGESGTGKEIMTNTIHSLSSREDFPLIKIDCAALPESLIEAELFGYKKGAFTDAKNDKPGRISLADGGTLFLDEIGELPIKTQAKLLRVLQEKEYFSLGATESIKVNVRVIAATNKNLEELVKSNLFREDLYYRLAVIKIEIPPLRERKEDLILFINYFLEMFCEKYNKKLKFSSSAIKKMCEYNYPGNIRELKNILEKMVLLCKEKIISDKHLPQKFNNNNFNIVKEYTNFSMSDFRKIKAQEILKKYNGNKILAAKELKISKTTFWRWLNL